MIPQDNVVETIMREVEIFKGDKEIDDLSKQWKTGITMGQKFIV